MTPALPLWLRFVPPRRAAAARTDPPPPKRGGPVFVQDAITPWGGETMLLALLREASKPET
ncbi:MAG: hypothetical protein NXH82_09595 [Rhodobacteraceae bacterium]|nr:hypothetical protein [Paracoccaceae bacterium]